MNKIKGLTTRKKLRLLVIGLAIPCLVLAIFAITKTSSASTESNQKNKKGNTSLAADPLLPPQIDVRGGTPRGLDERPLTAVQSRALTSLKNFVGNTNLNVRYNGLTATPMFISNPTGYLTAPSSAPAEQIARDFIGQWSSVFRFDQNNLDNLKLQSRAVSPEGITVMLFQQQANNLPVYHGEVLVNVNKAGQIMTVGGDSFPQMNVTNTAAISPATAVTAAASSLGVAFAPQSLGTAKILTTYGNLKPEFQDGEKFSGGGVFGDDIEVQTMVFPLGDLGRIAYKFNLTTPQFHGMMWENIVDAQDGTILRRISLTADFGETGGGSGASRRGTFRPDVQNQLEANNATGTAQGKVVDTMPASFSGYKGIGRAVRAGTDASNYTYTRPTYAAETETVRATGRGFKYSLVFGRYENPLFFDPGVVPPQTFTQAQLPGIIGQVTRGFPDASNPNTSSPFGWFYLPTGSNGAEITTVDVNRPTTRDHGYNTSAEAKTRNLAVNSPSGDGKQDFSADLTSLSSPVTLADGRTLNSVYQSRYAEGNNVGVSDDRANDNETTSGVKAYSVNRQFSADYYKYYSSYEFGGINATGGGTGATAPVVYPASSDADVYPGAVNLFYFNNLEHDYLYSIGFTEPFWNFQMDNFGKGGAGGDQIIAQVQDGSGTDNANMSSPAEGSNPRMQMFLFTDATFRRSDGDLDWDVVAHEHYHGVSNRSAAKGGSSCLGTPLVGESGGMGEGWSDFIASSMSDDDSEGEYVTGEFDKGIRRLPLSNYRFSYGSIGGETLNIRKNTNNDVVTPDPSAGSTPFEVHNIGEVWSAVLWDMRELMIVKQKVNGAFPGMFFDGKKRMGSGTNFYIGDRVVQSVDAMHPINYRTGAAGTAFGTTAPSTAVPPGAAVPTIVGSRDIIRPGMLAAENAANPDRSGPLATAVSRGGRLADQITLRGLQITPCNPTFIDMRDSMLAADKEITGGENQAIIWRAFTSHGVGTGATSSGKTNGTGQQGGPAAIVEDFAVPADVTTCELSGPLPAPTFTPANTTANAVTVTITAVSGATNYVIARSTSANGPFTTVVTQPGLTYNDNNGGTGLAVGQTYYYQVHAARSANCVGLGNINPITITIGGAITPAPVFAGVGRVADLKTGTTLDLSWSPATTTNPNAVIVYDIYRVINVINVAADNEMTAPTFVPTSGTGGNFRATVTGTNYTDTGLTRGQQYYYIVRARDTNINKIDTLNIGNTVTKLNAPTTNKKGTMAPFALEDFETDAGNARFTAPLMNTASPDHSMPVFQHTTGDLGGGTSTLSGNEANKDNNGANATNATSKLMFAPNFDPGNAGMGGPSDFFAQITPSVAGATSLNRTSILEFDHRYETEATFDGNNIEIVLGAPTQSTTPPPNNMTTFDLNDYIIDNGYTSNLNGVIEAAQSSPLMGRRSFTGSESLKHVKVAIGDFAPGGVKNPQSLPVYIRFHSTSDAGTFVDGWYIDNVVVNNFDAAVGLESDVASRPDGDGSILSDDVVQMRRFLNQTDTPTAATSEFQRADSAPRSSSGDGMILSDDIVQTRRYQNQTDPTQAIAGPTTAIGGFAALAKQSTEGSDGASAADPSATGAARNLHLDSTNSSAGQQTTINLKMDAVGDEAEYGFVVNYDTTKLSNPVVANGNAGAGTRSCNTTTAGAGRINCSVGTFPNNQTGSSDAGIGEIAPGSNQILIAVTFTVAANAAAGTTPVTLSNVNVSNDAAQRQAISSADGTVTIAGSTAATSTVSGRVLTAQGRGIGGAIVTMRGTDGRTRTVKTNAFGYYNFTAVEAGKTYIFAAKDKRYTFRQPSQALSINEDRTDLNFIGR